MYVLSVMLASFNLRSFINMTLASLKRSPNGTIRVNKHWDEIQQSKRNSMGGRNLDDQAGTGKSSPMKGR